jgi:hypothetical protein
VLGGLAGTVFAVLTTSEILIVDSTGWKLLLRQKHRRDRDPSLIMKVYSSQDGMLVIKNVNLVTHIFLYSRLTPLITVHQISEDVPYSWLDTPFDLPLPRHSTDLTRPMPNFGFVIIPSEIALNGQSTPSPETSITTYRLQPDLGIVGDMYATIQSEIRNLATKATVKQTETLSPRLTKRELNMESDNDNLMRRSNIKIDFSDIARIVLPSSASVESAGREAVNRLKNEVVTMVERDNVKFNIMYPFIGTLTIGSGKNTLVCYRSIQRC